MCQLLFKIFVSIAQQYVHSEFKINKQILINLYVRHAITKLLYEMTHLLKLIKFKGSEELFINYQFPSSVRLATIINQ